MKIPNFFIIGAPKCGTTSLAAWLSDHPNICLSKTKEPHYFNFDCGMRRTRTLDQYADLFSDATESDQAVGEATAIYLYSQKAVPAILAYAENPKFIVMLRNPIDMAPSLHQQLVADGIEDELDFETAWRLQDVRIYGGGMKLPQADPQLLLYGQVCKLGEQLQRLYDSVSKTSVHLVFLEDLRANPRREYQKVLDFLGLSDDGRTAFPVENRGGVRTAGWLWRSLVGLDGVLSKLGWPRGRLGFVEWMYFRLKRPHDRPGLSPRMRADLQSYFREDVALLSRLVGRDLRCWLSESDVSPDVQTEVERSAFKN